MRFKVVPNGSRVPSEGRDIGYLWTDNWNDYWDYQTLYVLTYFDGNGAKHELGGVKIGQFDWIKGQLRPDMPSEFEALDEKFFSLGQDVTYYTGISALGESAQTLLSSLNDVVSDRNLFARASREPVMGTSLMRSVQLRSIEGQFSRVLGGGVALTAFSFAYEGPKPEDENIARLRLDFLVTPESKPPTNIHVMIGRNGVGKSFLLNGMTRALVRTDEDEDEDGIFISHDDFLLAESHDSPFANLVSVTFSAFDDFSMIPERRNALKGVQYSNVGLRRRKKDEEGNRVTITLDPLELANEFSSSAKVCALGEGHRRARWTRALTTLQADPIFEEAQVASLADVDERQFGKEAAQLFRKLSSGHKIVLLTITKLVEKVEEKTLVLMDEPEAHLHPPLLSAFIRAVSDLLINRNGVAIVATHSPVILQEVPTSCVWKIIRHGMAATAERPEIETFSENVGVLTREVFGLEVTRSGFHKMLAEAIGDLNSVDEVAARFDNEVGSEGRALISNLIAERNSRGD
jgi:predicted ATPase